MDLASLSLKEAQLMKKPVIATNIGGNPEMMVDGKTGFLVEKDNPDHLIEKLIGAKTREELTTTIHALDRVLLWGHYVIPLYHSDTDRIAYWNFLEYPEEIPLYGIVIESWWINQDKALELQR